MTHWNRREFAAMLMAGALRAGAPEKKFPTEPRRRLAVATYPFRQKIGAGVTLGEFAKTIPVEFNVPGIEPWSHHFQSTEAGYLHDLRKTFDDAGVHVVNIPVDIRANLCGNDEERSKTLQAYHEWVDAAVILGSPSIRVHLPRAERQNEMECAVNGLKAVAEYGRGKNIVIDLENDDPQSEQPERIVRVIKAVKSPFLRALPDFANSMVIHNDRNYNQQAMSLLFPLAYNISHVKNMLQDGKTIYRVDVDPIFSIAKEVHYKGYFSMEWDAAGDPYEGTKQLIQASLRSLG
jgi:sugar phosphate isomerase/epimerase